MNNSNRKCILLGMPTLKLIRFSAHLKKASYPKTAAEHNSKQATSTQPLIHLKYQSSMSAFQVT